jgi:1,4-alpha-glucan branching enzyme
MINSAGLNSSIYQQKLLKTDSNKQHCCLSNSPVPVMTKPSTVNLKAYHLTGLNNVSFQRRIEEHKSWGVNYDPKTEKTNVKIWAPGAASVQLEYITPEMIKNDKSLEQILWDVKSQQPENTKKIDLQGKITEIKDENNRVVNRGKVFTLNDPAVKLPPGTMYRFVIEKPWGINIDPATGKTDVKIWTKNDTERIQLEYATPDMFAAKKDDYKNIFNNSKCQWPIGTKTVELRPETVEGGKVFALNDPSVQFPEGTRYRVIINDKNNKQLYIGADPYTKSQPNGIDGWSEVVSTPNKPHFEPDLHSKSQPYDINGWSQVINPTFNWDGHGRLPAEENISKWNVCELHTGTFSMDHNFNGVTKKLKELKEAGYTAVQLMPVGSFYSGEQAMKDKHPQNWNYDQQFMQSIQKSYGSLENYKQLIKACHKEGLRVVQDVIFNHTYIHAFRDNKGFNAFDEDLYHISEKGWGPTPKYSNTQTKHLAEDTALFFLDECRLDGLRLDSVHNCVPNGVPERNGSEVKNTDMEFLKGLAKEIQDHAPGALVTAEYENRNSDFQFEPVRVKVGSKYKKLFSAFYNLNMSHYVKELIVSNNKNQISNILNPKNKDFVNYMTGCHDIVSGDIYSEDGKERFIIRFLQSFAGIGLDAARAKLKEEYAIDNEMLKLEKSLNIKYDQNYESQLRIKPEDTQDIIDNKKRLKELNDKENNTSDSARIPVLKAKAGFKLARSLQALSPGLLLTYMGDESANIAPVRFLSSHPDKMEGGRPLKEILWEQKGYDATNPKRLEECTLDASDNAENNKIRVLSADLAKTRENNPALTAISVDDEHFKLMRDGNIAVYYRKSDDGKNETIAFINLSGDRFYGKYDKPYQPKEINGYKPNGEWKLEIDSDSKKYGGGGVVNPEIINFAKDPTINLAPGGVVVFSRKLA